MIARMNLLPQQLPLSVLMLTLNEETNLQRCLSELVQWADDVAIVDSFSTDGTVELAQRYRVRVFQHKFEGHARQWLWGMENTGLKHEWVFMYDPDHRLTTELRAELEQLFASPISPDVNGFYVNRRNIFQGKWIRHGGYYPFPMLKLVRNGRVYFDENEFDYRAYVRGRILKLKHDIIEENLKENDITFWIDKHNRFASRQAEEELFRKRNPNSWRLAPHFFGNPDQRRLWLKTLWYRMPLFVRPFLYFGYRYFLRLGFLDGKKGFIFHFLHAFWYRLIVDIKLESLKSRAE
jgi:glycosyltransferase involved in cell wall biosynthesis